MQIAPWTGQHFFAGESHNAQTFERSRSCLSGEIAQGIDDTDIKASAIKIAARSAAMTPAEEKAFKAAARASKATGIPVEAHTN